MSLVWQSASLVPAPQARNLFTFASGGHRSFNSERKVRKNATKTYGFGFPQRALLCDKLALCSSRNCLSRVPLSVKRTVPPQLTATASLPLPVATVAAFSSTAVPGKRDEKNGFPRRFAPRNYNVRGLSAGLLLQPSPVPPSFRASPQAGVGNSPPKAPSGGFIYCCGATRRTYPSRRRSGGWGAI